MIAGIDREADINIFFQENDLENLSQGNQISGFLIREYRLENLGNIKTSIDNQRQNLNGFGIGIDDKNYWGIDSGFSLDVFIGEEFFRNLLQNKQTGCRQSIRDGSKIHLYADPHSFDYQTGVDYLEFCRDLILRQNNIPPKTPPCDGV